MLLILFGLVFAATVMAPGLIIVLLILNTVAGLIISIIQMSIALLPRYEPAQKKHGEEPFVSILVPAYNEPPAILIQTLDALSKLNYKHFEVLVIDNNTKDPAVWKPVEKFVGTLGSQFRFFHVEDLEGFKAGALNYVLKVVNPKSTYAAVIDADYVVSPDFITAAVSYFTDDRVALVQFPQEYRNGIEANEPITDEYRHFFKIYMNMANHLDCVPSTGTVSVYKMNVLNEIGGFRHEALTEDADAGLRIYKAGYRGVYIDRPIGHGLIPYDIEAYRRQKGRWAVGNAQSIRLLIPLFGKISFKSWIGFLAHLTAWDHLNFLPFAVLAGYAIVVTPLIPTTGLHRLLLDVAFVSVIVTILSKFFLLLATLKGEERAFSRAIRAFFVHMGMTFLYSEALMTFFMKKDRVFERTNKFILNSMPNLLKNTYKELFLGLWFLIGAINAIMFGGRHITITMFFVSSTMLLSIYYIWLKISPTKEYSKKLLIDAENKYKDFLG